MADENKTFRVWHIPQVPGKPFRIVATSAEEAVRIQDILAEYDRFQYTNKIKPDYCNVSGIEVPNLGAEDGEPDWWEAEDELVESLGMEPEEWLEANPVAYPVDND